MYQIPTKEQWQRLFSVATDLFQRKLWEKYPEEQIFRLHLAETTHYVTIHGFEEDAMGFSVYEDDEEIRKFLRIIDHAEEISFQRIVANQSCLTAVMTPREYISPVDINAMEEGDYQGNGRDCVVFRRHRPGFAPWFIREDDADLLLVTLNAFVRALEGVDDLNSIILADPTTSIAVFEEREDGGFDFRVVAIDDDLRADEADVVKDDLYIARLKQLKRTGRTLEIDICYLTEPVGSQLGPIPFFPKMAIIGDVDEGYIADQCIFEESNDQETAFFEFFAKYLRENGLPLKIITREFGICATYLNDLCKKLRIQLDERKKMAIIDDFLTMIGGEL